MSLKARRFIAGELAEGATVKEWIKARPLKLDEALDIAIRERSET